MTAIDEVSAAVQALRTGRLHEDRALAVALDGWLTDITCHWTDAPPVERHHARAVARALNGNEN